MRNRSRTFVAARWTVVAIGALLALAACQEGLVSESTAASSQTKIQSFSAVPSEINPGDSITFTWEITGNQAQAHLCTEDAMRYPELTFAGEICQTVPQVGSLVITTPATVRDTLTFDLTASLTPLEMQEVRVKVRCPDSWFFDNPPDYCPASAAVSSAGMSQHFERGYMIQVETLGKIFVLLDEYEPTLAQRELWFEEQDSWQPGMPETDPDLSPPSGYYQPRRGMGLVWRSGENQWRDKLGWAVASEVEYRVTYQHSARQKNGATFLSGPGGEIMELAFAGAPAWSLWTGTP